MNRPSLRGAIYCLIVIGALYLTGCSSQPQQQAAALSDGKLVVANDILFTALGLVGTPYRYGGSTPENGFDCSGLIQFVYLESAALKLPRTVAQMSKIDAPNVDENNLQSGDLVIFATDSGGRPSHAGIYVGEGRFVHAPSRGGKVRMDLLSDSYWQRTYLNGKRLLAMR